MRTSLTAAVSSGQIGSEFMKVRLSYPRRIAIGFGLIILIGALLLMLPISSVSGRATGLVDALFTATSATCVTGLVVVDTAVHWSVFGQSVILVLIQVGGLGVMMVATLFSLAFRRRIGLSERTYLQESAASVQLGGAVRLCKRVLQVTFLLEGVCAVLLALRYVPDMGIGKGIYLSVFHSISAFCNAGFDLLGRDYAPFCSLAPYVGDPLINFVTMFLIVAGGLGFVVWQDLYWNRWHWKKYSLHTKIVLSITLILILLPAVMFWFAERNRGFAGLSGPESAMAALFQSVTYRTAGFSTVDANQLSGASRLVGMLLMMIGGSPGSTAGGMKTTTFFVIVLSLVAVVRNRRTLNSFRRRLDDETLRRACAICFVYIALVMGATVMICYAQPFSVEQVLYEVVSAVNTVGVSMGITPQLSVLSKLVVVSLMYFGRVGVLSILAAFAGKGKTSAVQYPVERIPVG